MPHERLHEAHQAQADTPLIHDDRRKNEKGEREEHEVPDAAEHGLGEDDAAPPGRRSPQERAWAGRHEMAQGAEEQGKSHRHADEHGEQEEAQRERERDIPGDPGLPRGVRHSQRQKDGDHCPAGEEHGRAVLGEQPLDRRHGKDQHAGNHREDIPTSPDTQRRGHHVPPAAEERHRTQPDRQ